MRSDKRNNVGGTCHQALPLATPIRPLVQTHLALSFLFPGMLPKPLYSLEPRARRSNPKKACAFVLRTLRKRRLLRLFYPTYKCSIPVNNMQFVVQREGPGPGEVVVARHCTSLRTSADPLRDFRRRLSFRRLVATTSTVRSFSLRTDRRVFRGRYRQTAEERVDQLRLLELRLVHISYALYELLDLQRQIRHGLADDVLDEGPGGLRRGKRNRSMFLCSRTVLGLATMQDFGSHGGLSRCGPNHSFPLVSGRSRCGALGRWGRSVLVLRRANVLGRFPLDETGPVAVALGTGLFDQARVRQQGLPTRPPEVPHARCVRCPAPVTYAV